MNTRKIFRIGTRGSRLALAQAREVLRVLRKKNPGVVFRLVEIRTTGDEFQSVAIFRKTNVGVFTKAIEKKLLDGEIDAAVHSLKDLPTEIHQGLVLAAVPKRLPSGDALISIGARRLSELPVGARVGTGSPRRKRQLSILRPDLDVVDLRGNLDTRVRRVLREKNLDAVVVAEAGLLRLGRFRRHARSISPEELLPAVGQAALGLQCREKDPEAYWLLRRLNHAASEKEVFAERALLRALHGGCRVPLGVLSKVTGKTIRMRAAVFSTRSATAVRAERSGPLSRFEEVGEKLAKDLLKKGAARILREARSA